MTSASTSVESSERAAIDPGTLRGLGIAGAAILLGALADALLRATPWGVNLVIWTSVLALATTLIARQFPPYQPCRHGPLLVLALVFAAGCAWRDSVTLKTLDVTAVLLLLGLIAWRQPGRSLLRSNLSVYLMGWLTFGGQLAAGFLSLGLCDIQWHRLHRDREMKVILSLAVGMLLALPILLVFGGLFSSADAAFQKMVVGWFDFEIEKAMEHLLIAVLGAWVACGILRSLLKEQGDLPPKLERPHALVLGALETGVVLACLNALFLAFILVQFRHFFGGATQVEIMPGLTYSEYARRGFFELAGAAMLLLPLLLLADWFMRADSRKRVIRILSAALIGMMFVIMASAVQRMRLYQQEYGLTELRLYTSAFMAWLAIVFGWFLATVLRGQRERFTFGAVLAGCATLGALHVANPDAWIVRVNVRQALAGKALDIHYATSLSADAVPALVRVLPELAKEDQWLILEKLQNAWPPTQFTDWRSASYSRRQARLALNRIHPPESDSTETGY